MYCKNCGAQNSENAKFCTSCGSAIEVESVKEDPFSDYYDEPVQEEQKEYNYNQSVQEGMVDDDRPSNVYGRKFEAHASGGVQYGKPRQGKSQVGKIAGLLVLVGIVAFVYFLFFANSGPIYDVAIGNEVNETTYYPDEPLDYIIASDGVIYISYSARDILYETVNVYVYDVTFNDVLIESMNTTIIYDEQVGYFSVDNNWTVGSYEIVFEIEGDIVYTHNFEVE
ncbi:hypothetical protein KQ51_01794 [Candidatus Izimaplasma bacterium HR1]|jgi:hypothetical protein|uniref:zinc ribbon domain-containing protein n=1 Tax=Candidatus Izimoplasma sp. HR1 TaxID=1541959 RepID=UPI0004F88C87|nr:hypothetical protein KQ51_01794 [Candidatus Izimaplasma bacterium HR1]